MGIFDRLIKRVEAPVTDPVVEPVSDPSTFAMWLSDCPTILTGYKRLSDCPEVVAAVNVYADLISSMTIHLMENGKRGDVRIRNALSKLVDITPNPYMSKRQFYANIVRVMLLFGDGNQVTVPIFKDGLIDRLHPLDPNKVKLTAKSDGYEVWFDRAKRYAPDEILHFRVNPDPKKPWLGTGYAKLLAEAVATTAQASATKKAVMEQPAPSLIVKVDSTVEELASQEGRKSLLGRFADSRSSGDPWFIPATMMDVEQIKPLTMRDLAIAENLELDKRQIAAVFGVPAFMVGVGEFDKNAYNNFIRSRVMPLAKSIEQELTRQLLIKPEWYFKFNSRSLMAYDLPEMVEAGAELLDRTAMSRNEIRDWIGMSPRDDMEDLIILENYLPIDRIGDQKKLVGGAAE